MHARTRLNTFYIHSIFNTHIHTPVDDGDQVELQKALSQGTEGQQAAVEEQEESNASPHAETVRQGGVLCVCVCVCVDVRVCMCMCEEKENRRRKGWCICDQKNGKRMLQCDNLVLVSD